MTIPDVPIGPFGWTCIAVGSWLILACVVCIPIGRAMLRADRDDTVRAVYPPPVPPSAPRVSEDDDWAEWLATLPVESLSDFEVSVRFWRIAEDAL